MSISASFLRYYTLRILNMIGQEHFDPQREKKTFVRQGVFSEIYDYMISHSRVFPK